MFFRLYSRYSRCLLRDYIIPTTYYQNRNHPIIQFKNSQDISPELQTTLSAGRRNAERWSTLANFNGWKSGVLSGKIMKLEALSSSLYVNTPLELTTIPLVLEPKHQLQLLGGSFNGIWMDASGQYFEHFAPKNTGFPVGCTPNKKSHMWERNHIGENPRVSGGLCFLVMNDLIAFTNIASLLIQWEVLSFKSCNCKLEFRPVLPKAISTGRCAFEYKDVKYWHWAVLRIVNCVVLCLS